MTVSAELADAMVASQVGGRLPVQVLGRQQLTASRAFGQTRALETRLYPVARRGSGRGTPRTGGLPRAWFDQGLVT